MKKICFLFCLLVLFSKLFATEYSPWFGNLFEFESRSSYMYHHYSQIATAEKSFSHSGNNHFIDLSLGISPWFDWNTEIEIFLAKTSDTKFNFEKAKLTGRYLIWNDLVCDPYSLSIGLSLEGVNRHFLDDFDVYEHGEFDVELHLALGKEIPECSIDTWAYHYWGLIGIGQANRGAPWVFGHAEWDINYCDCNELGFYADFLFGLGNRNIHPHKQFKGYAHIQHQSLDIGIFYRHLIKYFGSFTLDYCYRPYAHNFPESAHMLKATLLFTFGL